MAIDVIFPERRGSLSGFGPVKVAPALVFDQVLPTNDSPFLYTARLGFIPQAIDIDNSQSEVPIYGSFGTIRAGRLSVTRYDWAVGKRQIRSLIWPSPDSGRRNFAVLIPNANTAQPEAYVRIYVTPTESSITGSAV